MGQFRVGREIAASLSCPLTDVSPVTVRSLGELPMYGVQSCWHGTCDTIEGAAGLRSGEQDVGTTSTTKI